MSIMTLNERESNEVITNKGTWRVDGVNFIPTDNIYIVIRQAIEDGTLSVSLLKEKLLYDAPIEINIPEYRISFGRF